MKYLWDGKPTSWPGANLQPGDWVDVAYQPNLLKVKIHVYQPLTLNFLLGPNGQKTVMDANLAQELYTPGYFSSQVNNSGLICICPPAGAKYTDPQVGPVTINNVKIQNCNAESQEYMVYGQGSNYWWEASSGVSMYRAQNVVLDGVEVSSCGNGVFGPSYDYAQGTLRNICVRRGVFTGNGVAGSNHQHHAYLEAAGMRYEFCTFNALLDGAQGVSIKDRSAALVVRYCTVNAGSRLLDLVDPDGGGDTLYQDPLFGIDHVYGCLLNNQGGSVGPVHYGFDQNSLRARGQLRFYQNSVINWNDQKTGYYGTTFFKLNPSAQRDVPPANLYAVNNILIALSPDPSHYAGDLNFGSEEYGPTAAVVENNVMPSRTSPAGISTLYGWDGRILVDDPAFVDAYGGNFRLKPTSACRGLAWPLGTDLWYPVLFQPDGTARATQNNLGAYE